MKIKEIIIVFSFILCLFPVGSALAQPTDESTTKSESKISDIEKLIADHTPAFITKIIEKTVTTTENFRLKATDFLLQKKLEVKMELQSDTNPFFVSENTQNMNTQESFDQVVQEAKKGVFVKPIKYLELFFISVFLFFFMYQAVFYFGSMLIIFLLIRAFTKQ